MMDSSHSPGDRCSSGDVILKGFLSIIFATKSTWRPLRHDPISARRHHMFETQNIFWMLFDWGGIDR
jgi:hypothetical protein